MFKSHGLAFAALFCNSPLSFWLVWLYFFSPPVLIVCPSLISFTCVILSSLLYLVPVFLGFPCQVVCACSSVFVCFQSCILFLSSCISSLIYWSVCLSWSKCSLFCFCFYRLLFFSCILDCWCSKETPTFSKDKRLQAQAKVNRSSHFSNGWIPSWLKLWSRLRDWGVLPSAIGSILWRQR